MATDFEKQANELLRSSKLSNKKDELQDLANSKDGKTVKSMLDQNGSLTKAVETGDVSALKSVLTQVLSTDEGARLAKKLSELMK